MAAFRSRLELWAQVAGLVATAWVVWTNFVVPHGGREHLADRIARAVAIAFCALGWSALIGLTLLLVIWRLSAEEAPPPMVRVSGVIWLAPAAIMLLHFSPVDLAAGLVLIVSATRLFCAPSQIINPLPLLPPPAVEIFGAGEPRVDLLSRHFVPVLLISATFQSAAACFLMGHPLMAIGLFMMSIAVLTAVGIGLGLWGQHRPPDLPRSVLGLILTVLLALTIGRATGGGGWGFGWGANSGSESGGAITTLLLPAASKPTAPTAAEKVESRPETPPTPGVNVPGSYPGVILWPEVKPVTILIAPPPARGGVFESPAHPLIIPFGGEYWMYRGPYRRPPPNSFFRRGTPALLYFSTTDHWPLQMEAHQKLAQAITLPCCSRMRVAILNADRSPQTVSLEVILIDGKLPAGVQQSLGRAILTSVPDLKADRPAPIPETLDFSFPSSLQLDQFDEIKVVFHRTASRMDKSARVSIERLVLVPL
jgi:hypothetical protein